MSLLELRDVKYSYVDRYHTVDAVRGVECGFDGGQVYAIIGKSGSGKSTLLSLMAGLDLPTSGDIVYLDKSTKKYNLSTYRRECAAVIYQNFRLLPLLTAVENVMYPMELRHKKTADAMARAKELILKVGLPESVFDRFPAMLSGGEQQRVAIARALAMDTKLMLADEPTGNLDSENSKNIIDILSRLAHEDGYCVIIVTHDMSILDSCDVVHKMLDGRFTN